MSVTSPAPGPPAVPDGTPGSTSPPGGRAPWRAAGLLLTSLGTPFGIGAASPLLGQVTAGLELAVALAVIGTAMYGSSELSERAFRLLRWIANRPEPPAPAATAVQGVPHDGPSRRRHLARSVRCRP